MQTLLEVPPAFAAPPAAAAVGRLGKFAIFCTIRFTCLARARCHLVASTSAAAAAAAVDVVGSRIASQHRRCIKNFDSLFTRCSNLAKLELLLPPPFGGVASRYV